MFGPKLTSLFKSRWMALLWAAGIIWMAVDFVGIDGKAPNNEVQPVTNEQVAALDQFLSSK